MRQILKLANHIQNTLRTIFHDVCVNQTEECFDNIRAGRNQSHQKLIVFIVRRNLGFFCFVNHFSGLPKKYMFT